MMKVCFLFFYRLFFLKRFKLAFSIIIFNLVSFSAATTYYAAPYNTSQSEYSTVPVSTVDEAISNWWTKYLAFYHVGSDYYFVRQDLPTGPVSGQFASMPIYTHSDGVFHGGNGVFGTSYGYNPEKNNGFPGSCCGNPINTATGNKFQEEIDYLGAGKDGLKIIRYYGSSITTPTAHLGNRWRHFYDRSVYLSSYSGASSAAVSRPDGKVLRFSLKSNIWVGDPDIADQLQSVQDSNGNITAWTYKVAADNSVERYDAKGLLQSITAHSGYAQIFIYSDGGTSSSIAPTAGLLIQVVDSYGRQISTTYDSNSRVATITDSNGGVYIYGYDLFGNLVSVKYPDGKTRTYVYNESANTAGINLPNALTGIIDENGARFATWKYNTQGRTISSEHNLTNGDPVEKVSINYTADSSGTVTSSAVTDALNTTRTYSFTNVLGVVKNTGIAQSCSSGCGTNSAITYDANGNVSSKTDFNGNVTNYVYDLTRNLETSRTEAYGTSQARTITTQWHATYRLPTLITEPGKTTAFNYDASGNLLSKTITDTNLNKSRTWSWTYNSLGQVLTADGPRTDVNDVTTYTYYTSASDTAGSVHRIGDLATVTNAVGLVTAITNYDLNGRPLSITDPNGVVTTLTYWPRGWLKTRTVNVFQTTSYDYDGVGQLTKVTLPDGSYLAYTYDTAHRLTDISDNIGNTVHYKLDAMGNRTEDDTYDPSHTLERRIFRTYDALNRLQYSLGGTSPYGQVTQYGYDNNGNLKTITDPLNHVTTNGYDALNRLITVTDPANGVTTTTYNALDQITSVADPRLVTTNYTINALGDVTLNQSPDSGNTNNVYDAAGNLIQRTDARGVVSTYTYDALNRLTSITYPASTSENVTFTYDDTVTTNYRKGRLNSVSTSGSVLGFSYDGWGNVAAIADLTPVMWGVGKFQYDGANRLKKITYPNGRIVSYVRNALGQITQVQTQDNANATAQTLISNATYEPFGPLKSLTFGNGVVTTIAHDYDYRVSRMTTTSLPNWDYVYGYDAASNLTSMTDQVGSANKSYSYDLLNRLTGDGVTSYQYDAGGNRTLIAVPGLFSNTQDYANNSNRMSALAGSATPIDAAGNMTARTSISAMTYNNADRLQQATVNSTVTNYQYTGVGQRDGKSGAQTLHYDYLPDSKILSQMQLNADNSFNKGVDYIWLDDTPVAQIKTTYTSNNTPSTRRLTYIHADHLATPRRMTDSTQKVVWKWNGEAYGSSAPNTNPDGDSTTDTLDLRFPGQIADSETGLNYNLNRYYDPLTGRYTQSDPIGLSGGLNTYSYVLNNPILFIDPKGLEGMGGAVKDAMNKGADKGKFDFGLPDRCLPQEVCIQFADSLTIACRLNLPCINAAKEYGSYCYGLPAGGCSKQDCANAIIKLANPDKGK